MHAQAAMFETERTIVAVTDPAHHAEVEEIEGKVKRLREILLEKPDDDRIEDLTDDIRKV